MRRWVRRSEARGTLEAPPSKSYTHRALVAGYLSHGSYRVLNPLESEDTLATARGLAALGRSIHFGTGRWTLELLRPGVPRSATVHCAESGTTLRFLTAVASTVDYPVRFTGKPGLARRPLGPLLEVLRAGGVQVDEPPPGRSLPFRVRGPLHPLQAPLDISESSQYLSALLFTLPTLGGDSRLSFRGVPVSWEYVAATLAVLRAHGVEVRVDPEGTEIRGRQTYGGGLFRVPGDASSAAYGWAAAALTGGAVRIRGVAPHWPQADLEILPILVRMGARVRERADGATVEGGSLQGIDVDLTDAPDLYPLVGTLAAFARGTTRILGAPHIALKESDRRASTLRLVKAFGARAEGTAEGLRIEGTARPRPIRIGDLRDHRLLMSAAVGAMAAPGTSVLGDATCVRKSFPGFWKWAVALGMETGVRR